MAKFLPQRLWRGLGRFSRPQRFPQNQGFTLLEVLIAALLAGIIVSGLMYLVIEIMGTNQREAALDETQQDMQNALDYISTDLREAVYIYEGECLEGRGAMGDEDFCPGLINHLPANLIDDSVPVLALWKQEPYPDAVLDTCAGDTDFANCLNGNSYTLIVYSLSKGDNWDGTAQLTRYKLGEFTEAGELTAGYANPGARQNFRTWPFAGEENTQAGLPNNRPDVLVDFVDDGSGANAQFSNATQESCPTDYTVSPPDSLLASTGFTDVRSFYVCVGGDRVDRNTEVLVRLRGNPYGRPGINSESTFMTALETRVLSRGVIGKTPID